MIRPSTSMPMIAFHLRKSLAAAAFAVTALSCNASEKDGDGFVQMFNGKDLAGWQTTGNWLVKDGNIITLEPRKGEWGWQRFGDYLTTTRKYKDFVIDLEVKFNKNGNSGVFLRIGDLANHVESGFEVQIIDTHGKPQEELTHHDAGGVIRTQPPSKNMIKPAGEWNHYNITVNGNQLTVILNGETINVINLAESAMKDRPAEGYISFQDEGKPVWYRNVRIKELNK